MTDIDELKMENSHKMRKISRKDLYMRIRIYDLWTPYTDGNGETQYEYQPYYMYYFFDRYIKSKKQFKVMVNFICQHRNDHNSRFAYLFEKDKPNKFFDDKYIDFRGWGKCYFDYENDKIYDNDLEDCFGSNFREKWPDNPDFNKIILHNSIDITASTFAIEKYRNFQAWYSTKRWRYFTICLALFLALISPFWTSYINYRYNVNNEIDRVVENIGTKISDIVEVLERFDE